MQSHPAFCNVLPVTSKSNWHGTKTTSCIKPTNPMPGFRPRNQPVCMQQQETQSKQSSATVSWPPPDMTNEWAEAVERLQNGVAGATFDDADNALCEADGDEELALRNLVETFSSPIQKQREAAVQRAREAGDKYRVSAIKEAELRRRATGSAREFFKGFVETKGDYVDAGYVDEDADFMGKASKAVMKLFGGRK